MSNPYWRVRAAAFVLLALTAGPLGVAAQEEFRSPEDTFILPVPQGKMAMFEPTDAGTLRLFRFYGGAGTMAQVDLKLDDILLAINDTPVRGADDARKAVEAGTGRPLNLTLRRGSRELAVRIGVAGTPVPTRRPGTRLAERAPARGPGTAAQGGIRQVEFFIGEWDLTVLSADGHQVVGKARTEVRYILDGTAMQSDYYGLDPAGNTVFRGTTIRTYDPATGRFIVHWAMANLPGYTYIDVEYRDGELHGNGRGFDGEGEFVERYRYFDISETAYSFEMSRSYDGGETWRPYSNARATKRTEGRR